MAKRGAPKRLRVPGADVRPAAPSLRWKRKKQPEEQEIGIAIDATPAPLSELETVNREIEARKVQALQREAERKRALREIERRLKVQEARKSLVAFTEFAMPDPNDPDDATRSRYDAQYFHKALAAALEEVESGKILRLIVTFPPRHGKSELTSRKFPAWLAGRDPYRHVIFATYNQDFAEDFGRDVRSCIVGDRFAATFPGVTLRKGETAADRLRTEEGGLLAFVGRGGSITGRGADFLIIDDPLKDRAEAQSVTIRNELWSWFNDTAMTRLMSDVGAVIIIMCMVGSTRVLLADGSEKLMRDIRPGDRVATYKDGALTASRVLNWANQGTDRVFTIKTRSGVEVTANERHPFLVQEGGATQWKRLRDIKIGDRILRAIGVNGEASLVRTQDATGQPSVAGSACLTTISSAGRTESDPHPPIQSRGAARDCGTATGSMSPSTMPCSPRKVESAPSVASHPQPMSALIGVASSVSTTVTTAAGSGASCATTAISQSDTASPKPRCWPPLDTYEIAPDVVVDIVAAGEEEVFDIQVEHTENFIANGVVSHNTRWHEDDLVGRLTDPNNPHYNPAEAKNWKIINIPALAEQNDILGRKPGEALWPQRFGKAYLESIRNRNPVGFSALYQQRPSPDDGDFFKSAMVRTYLPHELPGRLRVYVGSDHAVDKKQRNDENVILTVGIDEHDVIWILDCWWKRAKTDETVEEMLKTMKRWRPITWWSGKDHITKSIGPFLNARMRKEKVYISIVELTDSKDKEQKAQAIQGRMSMGMVRFPKTAWWYEKARDQLLKFPNGSLDDFVDAISNIGRGLPYLHGASALARDIKGPPRVGTLAWVKADHNYRRGIEKRQAQLRSM